MSGQFYFREEYIMMKEESQDDAFDENDYEDRLDNGHHKDKEMVDTIIDNVPQETVEVNTEEEQSPVPSPMDHVPEPNRQEMFSNLVQKSQESVISLASNPIAS